MPWITRLDRWRLAPALGVALVLVGCSSSPTNRLGDISVDEPRSSVYKVVLSSTRVELNADGKDTAVITAKLLDAATLPVAGKTISFHLNPTGYTGSTGTVSPGTAKTAANGDATTTLTAPTLSYVPSDAVIKVSAVVTDSDLTPSPFGTIDIVLLPKGALPGAGGGGGGGGGGGATDPNAVPPGPVLTGVLPSQASIAVETPLVVVGSNFELGSVVVFQLADGSSRLVSPVHGEPTRLELLTPKLDAAKAGAGQIVVKTPIGLTSNPVPFTFTTDAGAALAIAALAPSFGPTAGGTSVTIDGTGFRSDDVVVFAAAAFPGGAITICGSAGPATCDNKTSLPKGIGCAAGVPADFRFVSSTQIVVRTQCVGSAAAGTSDVFVRRASGESSNPIVFGYQGNPGTAKPVIAALQQDTLTRTCGGCSGTCCVFDGYQVVITGTGFDPCASVVFVQNGVVHEFLPDPQGRHQAVATSTCALDRGLPSTCDASRPDLVPWPHSQMAGPGGAPCAPFAPATLTRGAYVWKDASEIRVLLGPPEELGCGVTDDAKIHVSNKPGSGLVSDGISAAASFKFVCQ